MSEIRQPAFSHGAGSAFALAEPKERGQSSWFAEVSIVSLAAVCGILAMGIKNGELNQLFYLLHGLRAADPRLLGRDWYTVESLSYHQWWDRCIELLIRANLLEAGLTAGTVAVAVIFTLGLYYCHKALYEEPFTPLAVTMILFYGLFTRGLGDWDLLAGSVEPFSISGALVVAGLACLAWKRPAAAGVCMGLSAFCHAHYAFLLCGIILLSVFPLWLREGANFTLRFILPFAVLAMPTLHRVFVFAAAPGGQEALQILSSVGPQHYFPWRVDAKPFILMTASIGFGAAGIGLRKPRFTPALFIPVAAGAAIVGGSLAICAADPSTTLERALAWRLAAIVILAALGAGAGGVCGALQSAQPSTAAKNGLWVLTHASLVVMAIAGTVRMRWAVLAVWLTTLILWWLYQRSVFRFAGSALLAGAALIFGMGPMAASEILKSHLALRAIDPSRAALYTWARSSTPVSSLWAVPPGWKDFRLIAERAILADWSATPFYPPDVIEWHSRMLALTGLRDLGTAAQADAKYFAMDCDRIASLRRQYGLDYVVTGPSQRLSCAEAVYGDGKFVVWRTR